MFSRVLYKGGSYIPQARQMLWPTWHNISDTIFEEESDKLDCYNNDLDPEDVAEACAKRYVGNVRDYQGVVRHTPWKVRFFRKFSGPVGMPGCMGARGEKGDPGKDGKSRSNLDLQCPYCNKFLQDEPRQMLMLEVLGDGKFSHNCNNCEVVTEWHSINGVLLPAIQVKIE